MKLRKTKTPGRCPVSRCKGAPRNLSDHPTSTQLCGSHHKQQWRLNNPVHCAFDNLRASARKRKIAFTLTFDQFKTAILPTSYMDEKGKERFCLHLDRKDSTRGYEEGNIQVLTCTENVQKENAERRQRFVDEKIHGRVAEEPSDADDSDLEYTEPENGDAF
jgi:hypothetical protein